MQTVISSSLPVLECHLILVFNSSGYHHCTSSLCVSLCLLCLTLCVLCLFTCCQSETEEDSEMRTQVQRAHFVAPRSVHQSPPTHTLPHHHHHHHRQMHWAFQTVAISHYISAHGFDFPAAAVSIDLSLFHPTSAPPILSCLNICHRWMMLPYIFSYFMEKSRPVYKPQPLKVNGFSILEIHHTCCSLYSRMYIYICIYKN